MDNSKQKSIWKKRRTLLMMAGIFSLPYVLAWLLYYNPQILNLGSRNHGNLISPLVGMDEYQLNQLDGKPFLADESAKKWTLMIFGSSLCEEACRKNLFTLQQLRRMLGVDKARLGRAYVLIDANGSESIRSELLNFAGTDLYIAKGNTTRFLEQKLGTGAGQLENRIVIADPKGNLVMYYPQDMDPKKIIEDIEILFGKVKGA